MAITLTHTASATTLTLPDALNWADEYTWSPVQQTTSYTTTGALLIEEATKQAGRPITLEGSTERTWCTRALVDQLHTWARTAGIVLVLTLRGVAHSVTFDHSREALQGLPVLFYADGSIASDDWYVPTLRFLEL
ncbi:MAG: hypothetical protein IPN53_15330 [Comamonadaceae bacterium]|nr:hypothetical protein [Comamonadaceae bacterium]